MFTATQTRTSDNSRTENKAASYISTAYVTYRVINIQREHQKEGNAYTQTAAWI